MQPTAALALLPLPAQQRRTDADRHPTEFMRNPLVAALVSGPATRFRPPAPDPADTVDPDLDELAARLPLPADAGQLAAIADACAGRTLVLDGAPGTGRTHTVAALAAAVVGAGRRVLVVAGARATRQALTERLTAAGLGAVLAGGPAPVAPVPDATEELRAARRALTAYRDRLHEPNSAGLTLYAAHAGTVGADADLPVLPVPPAFVVTASDRTVAAVRSLLAEFPRRAAATLPGPGHPWGLVCSDAVDPGAVATAAADLDAALERLPSAGPLARVVAAVRTPADLDVLTVVLAGPVLRVEDLEPALRADWDDGADALLAETAEVAGSDHPGLDVAWPTALDLPLAGIVAGAQEAAASGRLGRTKRLLAVRAELEPVLRDGVEVLPADVPALAEALLGVQEQVRDLAARAGDVPGLTVPWNWNPLLAPDLLDGQVGRLRRLRAALLDRGPFPAALRRYLLTEPGPDPLHAAALTALRTALETLLAVVGAGGAELADWAGEEGVFPRWEATRAGRALDEPGLPSLARWLELLRSLHLLEAAQLPGVRSALLAGAVPAEDAVAAFDRGLARTSLTERAAATGLGAAEAAAVQRAHDRALELGGRLRARVAGTPAPAVEAPPPEPAADVPALFADPADLPRCVLTTPAAVARQLPPLAGTFDLVLVEDAERLPVVDAIGALGRGRTAVVVGDGAQAGGADLLSACLRAGVPRRELIWQHRALAEELTAAAPRPGTRTFPSPGGRAAVSLVRTGGAVLRSATDDRFTNPAEADAVVAEVRRRPGRSVGVVALHDAQRALVEERLRATGDERLLQALADGTVWVREPADVAGRECDTVLLTLGCAPEGLDRLAGDLGPLARSGGEHLLTAAVTRARREVVVVASFPPALLAGGATSAAGVRRLRALLDVATGARPPQPAADRRPDAHREDVAAGLRGRGLAVRTDVGTSDFRVDLAVGVPGAPPVLAVLLDGPAWAARETVTDRDLVPAEALAARWPAVQRVWLPGWLADREAVLDRLVEAVRSAPGPAVPEPVEEPVAEPADDELDDDDLDDTDDLDDLDDLDDEDLGEPVRTTALPVLAPAVLPGEQPFQPWTPRPAGDPRLLHQLANPEAARAVRRTMLAGIAAEGPVHRVRLARLTAAAFGVARLSEARTEDVLALLPEPGAEYRWPAGLDPASWAGFRRQSDHADRPLEHVPPEEVANAMVALCRARAGLTREELFDETLAVFGHRRHHPVLIPYLEAALSALVRADRVTRAGGLIVATG
ncbi:hypothetical protein [Modestobacter sp. NPDC013298]|uniref:hypothetical protein n=1 Tax=Modestobacter sp. NPDC013298 TaxID=3155464 RepID=UPI0033F57C07